MFYVQYDVLHDESNVTSIDVMWMECIMILYVLTFFRHQPASLQLHLLLIGIFSKRNKSTERTITTTCL